MSAINFDFDLAILGAGAAGMMAAVTAAEGLPRRRIAIFEKNARPGIKVLVCGGGRCNFTNAGSIDFLIGQFGRNGRFLTPALRALDNDALREFFARLGVPSHVEPGGKVYPNSNQAKSVVDALVNQMSRLGVQVFSGAQHAITHVTRGFEGSPCTEIEDREPTIEVPFTLTAADGTKYIAQAVLLAVGGMSYQRMGTVGDGYRMAQSLGHSMITPRPAIVGLIAREPWIKELQGLAVRDVEIAIEPPPHRKSKLENRKSVHDLLFTHFGLSGPAILNPSEIVAELLEASPTVTLHVDFARHTSHDQAHVLLRNWQQHHGKKRLRTMLSQSAAETIITTTSPDQTAPEEPPENQLSKGENPLALPARLAVKVCELEGVSPEQACAALTSGQIHHLVERIKNCPFTITATRGFKEAMVTAGGVKLSEVNPNTMESRIVPNLFLSGEVLDLTGPSGGYNLQLAFSTGHLAAKAVAARLREPSPAGDQAG